MCGPLENLPGLRQHSIMNTGLRFPVVPRSAARGNNGAARGPCRWQTPDAAWTANRQRSLVSGCRVLLQQADHRRQIQTGCKDKGQRHPDESDSEPPETDARPGTRLRSVRGEMSNSRDSNTILPHSLRGIHNRSELDCNSPRIQSTNSLHFNGNSCA